MRQQDTQLERLFNKTTQPRVKAQPAPKPLPQAPPKDAAQRRKEAEELKMQKWKEQQLRMRQYQHQPEYLDKLLEKIPSSVDHKAFTSKSNIESMLWEDVRDIIAKSSFKQLPDKLPKRLGTPFQLFSLNLKQSGCQFSPKEVFLMWVRFSVDDKALYIKAQKTAIEIYTHICTENEQKCPQQRMHTVAVAQACTSAEQVKEEFNEARPEIQVSDTNPLYLIHTKAGRIAKANRPRAARLRSYKHNKAPSDVASLSPFASFVRQVRVAVNDELESEKPSYETYRALKDLWGMISPETKKGFTDQAIKSRWKYVEHWEAWLRRRFCSSRQRQLLPNLPIRPKTAFRYFFEHSIQLRKEKRENEDQYNLSPIPEIGEGVGIMALTKQKKRKPGFFSNISADWKTLEEQDRKVYEEYARIDEARYNQEILRYKEILENYKHQDDTSREFMETLRGLAPSNVEDFSVNDTTAVSEAPTDQEEPQEFIGTQRTAKRVLLERIGDGEDLLLTHLAFQIANNRKEQAKQVLLEHTQISDTTVANSMNVEETQTQAEFVFEDINGIDDLLPISQMQNVQESWHPQSQAVTKNCFEVADQRGLQTEECENLDDSQRSVFLGQINLAETIEKLCQRDSSDDCVIIE